jgi:hypothetical protein
MRPIGLCSAVGSSSNAVRVSQSSKRPASNKSRYTEAIGNTLSFRTRGFIYADSLAFADWGAGLDGHHDSIGHYEQFLFYADMFQDPQVRADDFVHLTHDGSVRVANWTAAAVADHWNDTTSH